MLPATNNHTTTQKGIAATRNAPEGGEVREDKLHKPHRDAQSTEILPRCLSDTAPFRPRGRMSRTSTSWNISLQVHVRFQVDLAQGLRVTTGRCWRWPNVHVHFCTFRLPNRNVPHEGGRASEAFVLFLTSSRRKTQQEIDACGKWLPAGPGHPHLFP